MSDPSRSQYRCASCHQSLCACDRSTQRNRRFTLERFPCPHCPMTVYLCVNDLNAHIEQRHPQPLMPTLGGSNGLARKEP